MRARRRRRQSGVTLIEAMVTMIIIAMVSVLIYESFVQTARNKRRIEDEVDRYHEIRMGIERMARELSMAYVSIQVNPDPALQPMKTAFIAKESGKGSRIDFTSFSHRRLYRDAHESDQNELSYFLADHPDDPGRTVLARREQRRVDDDPQTGGTAQILIDDVEGFELSFLEPLTGEWVTTWDTTQAAMQPNRLPSQVKILVTVPNVRGEGPDQTFGTRSSFEMPYALNHAMYKP